MALESTSLPSLRKGRVTTPTVSMPLSLDILAITGVAPVPVPPPMPAVMKSMRVFLSRMFWIWSWLSRAALRPLMGSVPAPRPWPIWSFMGTLLRWSAWASVLQTTKLHPLMPRLYM